MKYLIILLALTLFINCTSKKDNTTIPVNSTAIHSSPEIKLKADSTIFDSDDELESGIIKEAEEIGYSIVSITIKFPQRNWEESFNLNVEELKGVSQKEILNGIGKPVAIAYKKEMHAALMDLQSEGKSIFTITTSANERQLKKITGILSGVKNSNSSDLPGTITITSGGNEKISFSYFITPEIVRYNGKKLTALYADRANLKVLKFKML